MKTGGETDSVEIVDLGAVIDSSPISAFQVMIFVCCSLFALFDGLDTQSIGVAGPLIAHAFGLSPGSLGPIFSAGQVGAMVGALAAGVIGDRFGRKPALIVSALIFGIGTITTAFSATVPAFLVSRLIAGLGLGAATPCFVSLSAEFAPARRRGLAVASVWSAFPLGGFAGGLINPRLAEAFGWRSIFYFGGVGPLVLAVVAVLILPESLRYLAAKGAQVHRIRAIVRRFAPDAAEAPHFTYAEQQTVPSGNLFELFRHGRAVTTLFVWMLFIVTFSSLLFQPLWVPSLLTRSGQLSLREASFVVAMCNLGSVIGTAAVGRLIDKVGSTTVLPICYIVAAVSFAAVGWPAASSGGAAAAAFISCLCLGGASSGALALASSVYPTVLRSTGIGAAMSMARLGQIANALLVGGLVGVGWGTFPIFGAMASTVAITAITVVVWTRLPPHQTPIPS
jgi:MFS transporter, AAHS family, 4-hydroxybenzoate transporter